MFRILVSIFFLFEICNTALVITLQKGDLKVKVGTNIKVFESDSMELVCSDESSENNDLVWSKVESKNENDVVLTPMKTNRPAVLEFRSVLLQDEGRYWCTDKMKEELTSTYMQVMPLLSNDGYRKPVRIKTSFASFINGSEIDEFSGSDYPELVILQETESGQQVAPSTIIANNGDEIKLICVLKGTNDTLDYNIIWTKLEMNEREEEAETLLTNKSLNGIVPPKLIISPVSLDDAGRYICYKKDAKLLQSVFLKVVLQQVTPPNINVYNEKEQEVIVNEMKEDLNIISSMATNLTKKLSDLVSKS